MKEFERIFWIVLDSVGIGELPDAADYGDVGRNTLGHIAESRPLEIPTLVRLGLANIAPLKHQTPPNAPLGAYGKGATRSPGKDTTTGHWEMAGVWLEQAFPVYKNGFPKDLIEEFEKLIGKKTLGNKPASGTEIIKELGEEHARRRYSRRRALPHVRNRAEIAGRAASRRESDRAAVHGNAGQLCAHFAPARLCGGPAKTYADGCPGGTQSASVWNRQDS